ncbi:uncharacterized protein BJ171DRAFT_447074 [Polychytrium aggregatum]|uniref:uncharacterized protein n=1 Tax=Polychytrium aggregatum TaxID=110093 RepID=UPI0022FEB371|nr:uncharacterized protein BJ171DRAFT_447074 [Polychytrium aggregatum]KAI9193720.1 hypothetical protein BJ171DRAFT_447074 [Polychytrium aggregatum]
MPLHSVNLGHPPYCLGSTSTYNAYWKEVNQKLMDQLEYETPKDMTMVPKDREHAFQHLVVLYVRYNQIFKKLETAYDQIVHPQKRRLMREVLIAVISRLIEVKHKMVELELSDFHNFTDILLDLKLIPDDLRLNTPRFYFEEHSEDLEMRRKILDSLNARTLGAGEGPVLFPEYKMSEAVRMIQVNERGRQGKLRAKYMRDLKAQALKEKEIEGNDDESEAIKATLMIQRVYRGYRERKLFRQKMQEELIFLELDRTRLFIPPSNYNTGMAPLNVKESKSSPGSLAEANSNRRKVIQQKHEEEYQQALITTKEKIAKVEGPDMKEAMQDNFRQWYMEYKRINGKFPDFPADKVWQVTGFQFPTDGSIPMLPESEGGEGGSKPATAASKGGKDKDKKGDKKKDKGKDKGKGDKKKPGSGKKGGDEEEEEDQFKFDDSPFIREIANENTQYQAKWHCKEEMQNFAQKHDQEIIKTEKRKEVEAEVKKEVFEILKEELKNLKLAVERAKSKGKKGKGKGKKGKSGKKGGKKGKGKSAKGKKGKKGKKEKDLTSNRTMESLVEELVQCGILQKPQKTLMRDFKGDFNFLANSASTSPVIDSTLGEIQRVLTEYFLLPAGLPDLDKVPSVASMLLFGPRGTGKTMLVNAVANELGAYILNLTPRVTAGQYVGKPNVTKMVHMAFKVAKAHKPSIIYIDNIEMVFAKKVPKDDQTDPKRIKKDLLKQMKGLKASEGIIVLASSFKPWEGDAKAMLPVFNKVVYCPNPDYSSRLILWRDFIKRKVQKGYENVNLSLLTRMSSGFSAGMILLACERALTDRRIKLIRNCSLTTDEFVDQILNIPPVNAEESKLFKEWFEKTPMMKKRALLLAAPEEDDGGKKGGKEKGGKKPDKKKK